MGYFYRFHKVPKNLVEDIRKCKTQMEFLKFCCKHKITIMHDECDVDSGITECKKFGTKKCENCECFESTWVELYEIGDEIFNLGGNRDVYSTIEGNSILLFTSDELNEKYEEFKARICTKDAFWEVIKWYRDQIVDMYKDLLREKSIDKNDTRSQYERMEEHIRELAKDWIGRCGNLPPYNTTKGMKTYNGRNIEHLIFNLVSEFQDFDWENNELMFLGW